MLLLNSYRFAAGGGGDPNYAAVTLLLHCNGSNGSTTFTDNSPSPLTITANGNCQLSTAQSKFGTASMLCDGTGDSISHAANDAFRFPGDFTIEFFINPSSTATSVLYEGRASGASATGLAIYKTSTSMAVYTSNADRIIYSSSIGTGTWRHIALCRSGTAMKLFLDGTQVGSTYTTSANFSDGVFYLGSDSGLANSLNGYIDEVRITKAARYTGNFTPTSSEFPNN
jgi:hypothetical protein